MKEEDLASPSWIFLLISQIKKKSPVCVRRACVPAVRACVHALAISIKNNKKHDITLLCKSCH